MCGISYSHNPCPGRRGADDELGNKAFKSSLPIISPASNVYSSWLVRELVLVMATSHKIENKDNKCLRW